MSRQHRVSSKEVEGEGVGFGCWCGCGSVQGSVSSYFVEVGHSEHEEHNSDGRGQLLQSVAHYVHIVAVIVIAQTETLAW